MFIFFYTIVFETRPLEFPAGSTETEDSLCYFVLVFRPDYIISTHNTTLNVTQHVVMQFAA